MHTLCSCLHIMCIYIYIYIRIHMYIPPPKQTADVQTPEEAGSQDTVEELCKMGTSMVPGTSVESSCELMSVSWIVWPYSGWTEVSIRGLNALFFFFVVCVCRWGGRALVWSADVGQR